MYQRKCTLVHTSLFRASGKVTGFRLQRMSAISLVQNKRVLLQSAGAHFQILSLDNLISDSKVTFIAVLCCVFSVTIPCTAEAGTPFQEASNISAGLQAGRIQACPGAVNPNCVSTSSTNSMYTPPWRAKVTSTEAISELDRVVLQGLPGASKVFSGETPSGWYLAYNVKGKFTKPDIVEFLIKSEGVQDRNWTGDSEGPVVFYRSIAGDVKYIWPVQQPVTDLDTQRKRMQAVREQLRWPLVGCELIECYSDKF